MKTAREALATHLNEDMAEMKDHVYHHGSFDRTVYSVNNDFYSCSKKNPPKPTKPGYEDWKWEEVKDEYVNKHGWRIFKAKND